MQWRVCASHVNKTWVISQIWSEFWNDLKVSEFWSAKLVGWCKRLNDRVCLAVWLSWSHPAGLSHPAPGDCWSSGKEMGTVTVRGAASLGHTERMTAARVQGHFIVLHPLLAVGGQLHFTKQKTLLHFSSSLNCHFSALGSFLLPPTPIHFPTFLSHTSPHFLVGCICVVVRQRTQVRIGWVSKWSGFVCVCVFSTILAVCFLFSVKENK